MRGGVVSKWSSKVVRSGKMEASQGRHREMGVGCIPGHLTPSPLPP